MPGEHEFAVPSSSGGTASTEKLTNEDFRKLMMTPRSSGQSSLVTGTPSLGSGTVSTTPQTPKSDKTSSAEKKDERKKKKNYYAKLKRSEDDKLAELASKYRDRAKERRDGGEGSRPDDTAGAYRAVAPDTKGNFDAAERRRQMIQESKFLGGDMEHTHLVKGLDFALLQKVRSEIINIERVGEIADMSKEKEDEVPAVEETTNKMLKPNRAERRQAKKESSSSATTTTTTATTKKDEAKEVKIDNDENKITCKTVMAKNIVRSVFNVDASEKNELFYPGRMAYIVELEEDVADTSNVTDVPTTIIRSKADIQEANPQALSNSTNDIVINKLTQILSYLRAGKTNKKKKKDRYINETIDKSSENPNKIPSKAVDDVPIYDDIGDYRPNLNKKERGGDRRDRDRDRDRGERDRRHDRDHDRDRRDHRDHRRDRDRDRDRRDRDHDHDRDHRSSKGSSSRYFERDEKQDLHSGYNAEDKDLLKKLMKREEEKAKKEEADKVGQVLREPDHYAECYPGMTEMNDAIDDSDEEADYSKMDLGNKKGPIGRWDFDTAEEYADYMGSKEAMPKAAFQYGVKMNEGRKTRGKMGAKSEKAKFDKEWNKISAIIDKRKTSGPSGGSKAKMSKFD